MDTREIQELVARQRSFFASGTTRAKAFRREMLGRLYEAVKEHEALFTDALYSDFRKCRFESYATEIGFTLDERRAARRKVGKWMRPHRKPTNIINFWGSSAVYPEPYGCTLIIAPWNYPFQLAVAPLIGAVAAGNCAIVKPSEHAPATSHALKTVIDACFDPDYVAVVEGAVEETTALLNEGFDYIFYTGGASVGRIIMEAAAKHLTPLTLELGGKSPCIVHHDADIKTSARRITWGKFLNAGQTCVAPDYLYVHESVAGRVIDEISRNLTAMYGTDPQASPDYPRIINERHFNRLTALLDSGEVAVGGHTDERELYIAPTVLSGVGWDEPVMGEEIFGPILPVLTYNDLDEAVEHINARPKPLALYLFTSSGRVRQRIIRDVPFGCGAVNDTVMQLANPALPFGGVGMSGMGAYHGRYSFETFSHHKGVLNKSTLIDFPIRYAPYKGKLKLMKLLMK